MRLQEEVRARLVIRKQEEDPVLHAEGKRTMEVPDEEEEGEEDKENRQGPSSSSRGPDQPSF